MTEVPDSRKRLGWELFFVSFCSLFFELAVIRWLSCDFLCFAVFKTFPLVTCFVGLGVGVSKGSDQLFRLTAPALFLFSLLTYLLATFGFGSEPFPAVGLYQWTDSTNDPMLWFQIFRMILLIILLLAGPFAVMVCIGSRIGVLFNKVSPLNAYCVDIAGAIAGSLLFALSSFLGLSPAMQTAAVAFMLLFILLRKSAGPAWITIVSLVAAASFAFLPSSPDVTTYWSPYTRVDLSVLRVPSKFLESDAGAGNMPNELEANSFLAGILLRCNHGFQQIFAGENQLPLNEEGRKEEALKSLSQLLCVRRNYYGLPYSLKKPKRVLVLGAGTGSDVYEAVKNSAEHVDAVEIDPSIVGIGKKFNPVYSSDKVNLIVNDARNYVNSASDQGKRYDMIVIACLDSLAFTGSGSSMRTDSYVHSRDCYERCLKMLEPDGIFVVSFGAPVKGRSDWLRDKMYLTLKDAAGYPPLVEADLEATFKWPAFVFISGEPVRKGLIQPEPLPDSFQPVKVPPGVEARILNDDWPYLYIRPLGLDLSYLSVVLVVVVISLYASRRLVLTGNTSSDLQMFALGAAFMLLELQAISRLSLLYGSTWLTSSIVINGVLLMILAANFIVLKLPAGFKQDWYYLLLLFSLLLSYAMPVNLMLSWDQGRSFLGHASITVISLLPVFAAGLTFATAFSRVENAAKSFAFNLLGSVAGALLEYLSIYIGIKSLLIVAFVCYFVSYLAYRKTLVSSGSAT